MAASGDHQNKTHHFLAGGVAGVCAVVSGHPLDTVKVRLQTANHAEVLGRRAFGGVWDCLTKTVRHEGVLGLYRGLVPPLLAAVPANAFFFAGSAFGRSFFHGKSEKDLTYSQLFLSGCFGGFAIAMVLTPTERIKCILQAQQDPRSTLQQRGVWGCTRQVVRQEGFRGLYRGMCITLLRDIPSGGGYILTYYAILRALSPERSAGEGQAETSKWKQAAKIMFAGGFAGMSDWVISIAPDTLKSRIQTAPPGAYPNGARDAFRHLMATEGVRGLFHGLSAVMVRAYIANAFCLLGYEATIAFLSGNAT